ncbi:MAG: type II toxin-antitoxin system VapC family toxin [Acetobacteraceae bacterium]
MKYLLDTNAVIALLKGNAALLAKVHQHLLRDFSISAVAAHELFFGAYRSKRVVANLARLDAMQFEVLEFDKEDARQSGEIRATLAAVGTPIGPYDILIAGQARARSLILITRNGGEFSRVPGLHIEDWEA